MLGKILPHIFTELCAPKFAWSLLLKILNTYFLKLFPSAATLPHYCVAVPASPVIPSATMVIQAGEWTTRWLKDNVGWFEMRDFENNAIGSLSQSVELRNRTNRGSFFLAPSKLQGWGWLRRKCCCHNRLFAIARAYHPSHQTRTGFWCWSTIVVELISAVQLS